MRTICALLLLTLAAGCSQSEPSFTSEAARREHEKMQARLRHQGSGSVETRTAAVSGSANVTVATALEILLDDYEAQLNQCEAELKADPQSFPADVNETHNLIREGRATIKRTRAAIAGNPDPESVEMATANLLAHMQQFEDLFEQLFEQGE